LDKIIGTTQFQLFIFAVGEEFGLERKPTLNQLIKKLIEFSARTLCPTEFLSLSLKNPFKLQLQSSFNAFNDQPCKAHNKKTSQ